SAPPGSKVSRVLIAVTALTPAAGGSVPGSGDAVQAASMTAAIKAAAIPDPLMPFPLLLIDKADRTRQFQRRLRPLVRDFRSSGRPRKPARGHFLQRVCRLVAINGGSELIAASRPDDIGRRDNDEL